MGPLNKKCPWCRPWYSPATRGWYHLYALNSSFDQGGLSVLVLYASPWKFKLFLFIALQVVVGKVYQIVCDYPYFLGWGELPLKPSLSTTTTPAPSSGDDEFRWPDNLKFLPHILLWSWGDVVWVLFFLTVWKIIRCFRKRYQCCVHRRHSHVLVAKEPEI